MVDMVIHPAFLIVFYVGLLAAVVALCRAAARGDREMRRTLDEHDARASVRPLSSAVDRCGPLDAMPSADPRVVALMRTGRFTADEAAAAIADWRVRS